METGEVALLILDIYQVHDEILSKKERKPLFPVFYEDLEGNRKKWWFLKENIKDVYLFIKSLIELGIIKGRVMTIIETENKGGRKSGK